MAKMNQHLTPAEQAELKRKYDNALKIATEKVQKLNDKGIMECESSVCDCILRRCISIRTFSTVVTPDFEVELVCEHGALRFAHLQNVTI